MDSASNNFSYTVGGIALGGSAFSVVRWARKRLPSRQMKALDGVLQETRQEYRKSDEEGLLPDDFKDEMGPKLVELERLREKARERTYRAITIFDQVMASVQGLSKEIGLLLDNAKLLRAEVVTRSEESRRFREARNVAIPSAADCRALTSNATLPTGGQYTASEAPRSDVRMPVNEPDIPPIVYCRPYSSQVTLVQISASILAAQPSCESNFEDHSQTSVASPHLHPFTWWSDWWRGRPSSEQPPPDIETGLTSACASF